MIPEKVTSRIPILVSQFMFISAPVQDRDTRVCIVCFRIICLSGILTINPEILDSLTFRLTYLYPRIWQWTCEVLNPVFLHYASLERSSSNCDCFREISFKFFGRDLNILTVSFTHINKACVVAVYAFS